MKTSWLPENRFQPFDIATAQQNAGRRWCPVIFSGDPVGPSEADWKDLGYATATEHIESL